MERFPYFFLLWFFLSLNARALANPAADETALQQLETLRLKTFAFKAEAQAEIDALFVSLNANDHPRAWLKAYALASAQVRTVHKAPPYSTVLEQAQQLADPHLLATLYLSKALQSRGEEAMEQAVDELKKAVQAARAGNDPLLVGMILAETAYTYSIFHNRHGGIQAIEEALAIMQAHPDHPHYLYAQSTLSILMYYLDRKDEALRISKEVFQKFSEQKNYYSAAIEACNIGLAYRDIDPHSPEVIAYFDAAIKLAAQSRDRDALAGALSGKAHAYLDRQPAQAIPLLHEVIAIYQKENDKIFETEGILTLAEAYLNAGDIRKARRTINKVRRNPKYGNIYTERTLSLESRIAAAERNFEAAYKAHLAYHDYWETRKKTEESAELSKLSSALNFKLEEEKNRTLQVELENQRQARSLLDQQNRNQQLALEKAEKEKQFLTATLGLCLIIVGVMLWGLWQGYQIKRQKKLQQEIMDSVHEGILRFGADRRIAHPYSKHLEELLGQRSLSGAPIVDLLFPESTEQKSMIEACLSAIIDEDRTAWEFNAVHLPSEIQLKGRILQLFWHPILNRVGLTDHVMLVLRDITEQRNYEKLLQNERHERDQRNIRVLELRHADRLQVERFLQRLHEANHINLVTPPPLAILLRHLHTWKGEARTHGLKELAAEIHQLEDLCAHATSTQQLHQLQENLNHFQQLIDGYRSLLEDPALPTQVSRRLNLLALASDLLFEARSRLQQEGIRWGGARVTDALEDWNEPTAELVRTVLLHAISNSIDHGFVRAPDSFRSRIQAQFEVEIRQDTDALIISLGDNGQGIQWSKIEDLARSKGLATTTREELVETLFRDGFSTADQLSLSSGRGVGLAAIKGLCDEHGGQVRLMDRPAQPGTQLEVRLPLAPLRFFNQAS
ncbi:ATP-binding protein [Oligoflexus tunisiensis]|uniref:ATP-binding protein n=1 Tax=Oligoflexus tunisiensis TaxID=708132 RepID=UPI00159F241A|nr:ATP-binding protein [Oligoflexus tunisiensis]